MDYSEGASFKSFTSRAETNFLHFRFIGRQSLVFAFIEGKAAKVSGYRVLPPNFATMA